uniref:Family with sequence similarity 169 member B n=1 Tax=Myotis myotis TaxID=51298 RepID=A0A7J7RRT8_MYOMY|nr:family with sequence similarity 169 member B [Myotis myotis]
MTTPCSFCLTLGKSRLKSCGGTEPRSDFTQPKRKAPADLLCPHHCAVPGHFADRDGRALRLLSDIWPLSLSVVLLRLIPTVAEMSSLCGDGTGSCYLLPVLDTVFVRRRHRGQGLGVAMLRDFCETFPDDEALGVSWPISPAMYQVCRKFLLAHPEEQARLWEVEPPGAWGQRGSIWLKVQLQQAGLPAPESA